jgi:hypothetical protein
MEGLSDVPRRQDAKSRAISEKNARTAGCRERWKGGEVHPVSPITAVAVRVSAESVRMH